jgi:catechol 2,3-dioxygenase-like lactoylglutathione lyase family enzyme
MLIEPEPDELDSATVMVDGTVAAVLVLTSAGREEGAHVSEWERKIGAMTLFVGDLDRSKAFYQGILGLTALGEDAESVTFRSADMYVFLHRAPGLSGAPAPAVLSEALNGAGQFAIIVADVDAVAAELSQRGAEPLSGPADRPWGMRTVTFADPDGHVWEIAQPIPDATAS